jgi:tRNA/tmRNA/rRNA uracil-C5-methylase (TrmA/RlmC/RlmD family)
VLTDYAENRNERVNDDRLTSSINCEHFGTCPGCVVNEKVGNIDIIKSAKLFFSSTSVRKRRLDVPLDQLISEESDDGFYNVVIPSSLKGWRTQAKLAVAPISSSWEKGCAFGLFKRGTHSVLSIPNCEVHHPSINRAVHALVAATEKVGTAAFEPDKSQGGLRYVQFQVERTTGKVCLTFVWYAASLKEAQPYLSRLQKELQRSETDLWHSLWCHCNDGSGNNIFSRNPNRWHQLAGPEFVREPFPIGDKGWLYFSPLAFRQGNMDGFDILAADVARAIPGKSRVCELYAGIGLLGLTALLHHDAAGEPLTWVRCSDENPANTRCFQRSVSSL